MTTTRMTGDWRLTRAMVSMRAWNDRKILQRTKSLLRFLGLGHMRNAGAELPYRKRVEFMLNMIFGPTFDKNSYWYGKPNPDEFFTSIMVLAGAKDDIGATEGGQIFKLKPNTQSYEVSRAQLSKIGVDEDKLRDLFAQTPAADEAHRKLPTRPLFVPNPRHLNQVKGTYDRDAAEELGAADVLTELLEGGHSKKARSRSKVKKPTAKKPTAKKRKAVESSSKESESEKVNLEHFAEELLPDGYSSGKPDNKKGKQTLDDLGDDEPDDAQPAVALEQCEEYDDFMKGQFAQFGMGLKIRPIDGSHSEWQLADVDLFSDDELEKLHQAYEISGHDACNPSQAQLERAAIEHDLLRMYAERERENTMGLTHSIDVLKTQLAAELEEPFRAQATELMRQLGRIVDQASA
jgi:hypothetical protein